VDLRPVETVPVADPMAGDRILLDPPVEGPLGDLQKFEEILYLEVHGRSISFSA
jgi:hypothetical protein